MHKLLLIALAAVIMLLPVCAVGEANQVILSVGLDKAFLPQITPLVAALAGETEEKAESTAEAIIELLNGLNVEIVSQENTAAFELSLKGEPVIDFSCRIDDSFVLTSTLLPGMMLFDSFDVNEVANAIQLTDGAMLLSAMEKWLSGIEMTTERGAFSGDAYDSGTLCTTTILSGQDIQQLVEILLDSEFFQQICMMNGIDSASFKDVSAYDGLECLMRIVTDEQNRFVGASATINWQEKQLCTLSYGAGESSARLVVGLGLLEENYWYDLTAFLQNSDGGISLSGTAREWTGLRNETFSYLTAFGEPASSFAWRLDIDEIGKMFALRVSGVGIDISASCSPAPSISLDTKGLTVVDMSDEEAFSQAATTLAVNFLQRLIKVLPSELTMLLLKNAL